MDLFGLTVGDVDGHTHTIGSSVVVAPGGYVVLGTGDGTGWSYGVTPSYWYGSDVALGNNGDQLILSHEGADGSTGDKGTPGSRNDRCL